VQFDKAPADQPKSDFGLVLAILLHGGHIVDKVTIR
jgi:hypothetical protein